jgi:hypothetical protein
MSIYSSATLGWPDNMITFNNYSVFPVYRAQSRSPLQFNVRDSDIPIPFESGINDFETLIGKTVYAIKGVMYPRDESSYYTGIAALRAACSLDLQQNSDYNIDSGYVPYTWVEGNNSKTLFLKAMYVKMTEDTRQGYVQPFVIYCKVKDPTIYSATLKTASTAASSASTTTGGAAYPIQYPVLYGSTLYTVSSNASNLGNIPSYPNSIDVYGPTTNPKVLNSATGEYIQVNTTLNSVSDVLHIAYDNSKMIVTLNGNSVFQYVTSDSTYFKIQPGDNIITLSGSSVGTGAYCNLFYRDSYALA